jgi:chemotaxis protein MotB
VEGFTDNVPINTPVYPSNWELSAARSATVVRLLSQFGIEPSRMVAMGYAEFRPKSDNLTEQGRTQNRRVVLTILAELDIPRGISDKTVRDLSPEVTIVPKLRPDSEVISLIESE